VKTGETRYSQNAFGNAVNASWVGELAGAGWALPASGIMSADSRNGTSPRAKPARTAELEHYDTRGLAGVDQGAGHRSHGAPAVRELSRSLGVIWRTLDVRPPMT
jgi:hypothetical protein